MKTPVILLALFLLGGRIHSQSDSKIRLIDSIVNNIKTKSNLFTKTFKDTARLSFSNGASVMEHCYTLKCQFEKDKPEQLVKVVKEKTVYYYNSNELVKVQDNTEIPERLYFWQGQLISSNVSQEKTEFHSRYHLMYAKRFLEKFLTKS